MSLSLDDLIDGSRADVSSSKRAVVLNPLLPARRYERYVYVGLDSSVAEAPSVVNSRQAFFATKRVLDVLVSLIAIAILIPVLTAVAIAIFTTSRGPVLFRQQRVGLKNTAFTLYKFRSMYVDKQDVTGIAHTVEGDPRVTPVGWFVRRTHLDELPQLVNVLMGDMSLVGPRAQVAGMRAAGMRYEELVPDYRMRHAVRPGITGLAQVRGFHGEIRDAADAIARVDSDLEYVRNATVWLDLKILLLTLPSVILGAAAVRNGFQAPG
jgi:lipopolysaccharide/colanic/teichoic acid biosynthesis glycosyltransferase